MGHRLDYGIAALVGGLGMLGVLWLIRKVLSVADLSLGSGIDMLLFGAGAFGTLVLYAALQEGWRSVLKMFSGWLRAVVILYAVVGGVTYFFQWRADDAWLESVADFATGLSTFGWIAIGVGAFVVVYGGITVWVNLPGNKNKHSKNAVNSEDSDNPEDPEKRMIPPTHPRLDRRNAGPSLVRRRPRPTPPVAASVASTRPFDLLPSRP